MKLYYSPLSSNARRAVLAALELGVDLDLVAVDLAKGEHRRPEFLARNPNGKIPVLESDGFVLWESYAIMKYLADTTPGQTLYPTDPRARADVDRWMYWCAAQLMVGVSTLNWEHHVKPLLGLGAPDPARVEQGKTQLAANLAVLDAHLEGRSFVCGERLSLADLALAAPFMHALPFGNGKHLHGWLESMRARESWKRTTYERATA